jgi:hypothetical protein
MAKRKSKKGSGVMSQSPSMPERNSVETEEAENGYVVRVTHEGKDGYKCKRYVALSQPEAQRIAGMGMRGLSSKKSGGKKKSSNKRFSTKKA